MHQLCLEFTTSQENIFHGPLAKAEFFEVTSAWILRLTLKITQKSPMMQCLALTSRVQKENNTASSHFCKPASSWAPVHAIRARFGALDEQLVCQSVTSQTVSWDPESTSHSVHTQAAPLLSLTMWRGLKWCCVCWHQNRVVCSGLWGIHSPPEAQFILQRSTLIPDVCCYCHNLYCISQHDRSNYW